ncbi:BTB/POZ domain containing protein [Pandoravirus neocaledonia]|uniref:BTB/POZ domain containing protein n=1 Tax=Pandoravirus neocaledonia TaxID=2107708 RepID=A0A2U7UCI1_9VIRU|nr:BTB/POZ domain containing protein [Pandoravirus neocaledonia]AVK76146.1 BTB/POZ domain containing protein [Pandoravirus neocaledonia]
MEQEKEGAPADDVPTGVEGQHADSLVSARADATKTAVPLDDREGKDANEPPDTTTESHPIVLDVGGQKMMTSRATFATAPPGSLLGRMFGPDADPLWAPPRLADGSYFLDLNPHHFAVVLDVLRHGPAMLRPLSPADRGAVTLVADYLGLDLGATTCLAGDVLRYRVAMAPDSVRLMILAISPSAFWSDRIGLCDWSANGAKATYVPAMRSWTLAEARDMLSLALNIPADLMVAHFCLTRRNGTTRPNARLPLDSTTVRLRDVHAAGRSPLALLIHQKAFLANVDALPLSSLSLPGPQQPTTNGDADASPQTPKSRPRSLLETMIQPPDGLVLIFVRCFDRSKESLSRAQPLLVDVRDTIAAVVPAMCALLSLSGSRHVHLFEEVSMYMVLEVDPTLTFADAEIGYGDIVWLEAVDDHADAAAQQPVNITLIKRLNQRPLMRS